MNTADFFNQRKEIMTKTNSEMLDLPELHVHFYTTAEHVSACSVHVSLSAKSTSINTSFLITPESASKLAAALQRAADFAAASEEAAPEDTSEW